jgi:hypothetical protein
MPAYLGELMAGMEIIYPGNMSLKVDRDGNATIDETARYATVAKRKLVKPVALWP